MIIDLHCHIWTNLNQLGPEIAARIRRSPSQHWGQFEASAAALERATNCVDGVALLGFRSELLGARVPNELIAECVLEDPQRRIGVAGIDPMSDDAMDQVQQASDLGLVAISISPACQGFHPAHSAAMQVYELCDQLGLPLFVTTFEPLTPSSMLEFGSPILLDEVARSFPNLPIVIGRLGQPWMEQTLTLLSKHENVFADLAGLASRPWQLHTSLLNAWHQNVMDKLLFGSGFPHEDPARMIEVLYSTNALTIGTQLPSIPRAQIHKIVEQDSLARLGIDAFIKPREQVGDTAADAPAPSHEAAS
jgi:predicted TIM-barrel fold metal-dependent hydrolase